MFKKISIPSVLLIILNYAQAINAADISLILHGQQAKQIYQSLSGPAVQNEGAAGHLFRKGKSILCRYTDVDMDDKQGNPIPNNDPRRYVCSIKFNNNGLAFPSGNP
jgi:hypothetical protein